MNNIPEHIEILIAQYFDGSISDVGQSELNEWLTEDDAHQRIFDINARIWESSSAIPKQEFDVNLAWNKVSGRLNLQEDQGRQSNKIIQLNPFLRRAAVVLAIATIGLITYFLLQNSSDTMKTFAENGIESITLSDSSFISLNNDAILTYPKVFAGNERKVKLQGEAYFKVHHNKEQPFIIEAANIEVTVLGTEFYVQSIEGENTVKVSVSSGKVSVKSLKSNETHILTNTESISYTVSSDQFEEKEEINSNEFYWHQNVLEFKDRKITDVFEQLENQFGVEIEYPNQLSNCRYSSRIQTESAEEVIKQLCLLFQLNYTKDNNRFVITGTPNC
jgi:ferric-dicitrate binding protein FerR (iron transport regulator)